MSDDDEPADTRVEPFREHKRAPSLPPPPVATESTPGADLVDPSAPVLDDPGFHARYESLRPLGTGGMGEVRLALDRRIGREVALKLLRADRDREHSRRRFLREVRVTGQLEHPSVVPVYDLGVTPEGRVYFTMKRVRGLTLSAILRGLRARDWDMEARYPRRRLLSALAQASLAIAYAHERGVVHRDLKPDNLMLGDFGEVYVLDWGVAKILGAEDGRAVDDLSTGEIMTMDGMAVGTPGYMSPEQAQGESARVDGRADVYSLGAMLFEVLALEPLNRGTDVAGRVASTLRGETEPPSRRRRAMDVPPELDAIVMKAVAFEPADRHPTMRALSDALAGFLDGERDGSLRRGLARGHVETAQAALARATAEPRDAETHRATALRELASALALDKDDPVAVEAMLGVVLAPAGELPPEVATELTERRERDTAKAARRVAIGYGSWLAATPLLLWMGVRSGALLAVMFAIGLGLVTWAAWAARRGRMTEGQVAAAMPFAFMLVSALCLILGPLVIVPTMAVTHASIVAVSARPSPRVRHFITALSLGSVAIPFALQLLGLVPPSYVFEDGALVIRPLLVDLPALPTMTFLATSSLLAILVGNMLVGRSVEALRRAEQRLFVQAWRLRRFAKAPAEKV
jgi:serine/threonine-protein kinase